MLRRRELTVGVVTRKTPFGSVYPGPQLSSPQNSSASTDAIPSASIEFRISSIPPGPKWICESVISKPFTTVLVD